MRRFFAPRPDKQDSLISKDPTKQNVTTRLSDVERRMTLIEREMREIRR